MDVDTSELFWQVLGKINIVYYDNSTETATVVSKLQEMTMEISLNVFTEFSEFSDIKK